MADTVSGIHARVAASLETMGVGLGAGAGAAPRADGVEEDAAAAALAAAATTGGAGALGDVRRFLNRLLGLPLAEQNLAFAYFQASLGAEIAAAKAAGLYVEGVADLPGQNIARNGAPEVLWVDALTGLRTVRHEVTVDRGMSFEAAAAKLAHERRPDDHSGFRVSRRPMFGRSVYILALQKPDDPHSFAIFRPNTGGRGAAGCAGAGPGSCLQGGF